MTEVPQACAGCGRATPQAELRGHEALEQVRTGRDGEPRLPEPPMASLQVVERSPRYTRYLVTRRLCPDCLAEALAGEEAERAGLRRLTAVAAMVGIAFFILALLVPQLWPTVVRWLSLRPASAAKPWTSDAPPAHQPYKPPFPAAMPAAP